MNNAQKNRFEGKADKPFDPLAFIKTYKWTIAIRSAVILLLTCPLLLYFMKTSYQAQGVLQISPVSPVLLEQIDGELGERSYSSYVSTQVARLQQHELLMSALNRLPPAVKSLFVNENETLLEAADRLTEDLSVQQVPRTHLIALTLQKYRPDGLAEMINSILTVYLERLQEEEQGLDNRLLTYLRQERKRTQVEINNLSEQLQNLAISLGVTSFSSAENYVQSRHLAIQEQYLAAQTATLQATKTLEGLQSKAEKLKSMPMELLIQEELSRTPGYLERKAFTYNTVQELTASIDTLAENNPAVTKVRQRIEEVESQFSDLEQSMSEDVKEVVTDRIDFQIGQEILEAEHGLAILKEVEDELAVQLEGSANELISHTEKIVTGQRMEETLLEKKSLLINLENRIYQLTVEGKAPGRTSLEGIARAIRVSNLKKLSAAGIGGSIGLALLLTFFQAVTDRRVRSKKETEEAIGETPSWPIPFENRTRSGEVFNFSEVTLKQPDGEAATAIRSLAVKLDREREAHGSKLSLFTGVGRKAGTTRLVINTAHAMKESCEKVLIIDLNRQHSAMASLFAGLPAAKSAIMGAVHDTTRGIDVLAPCANFQPQDMDRQAILNLLEQAEKEYDFVLIDSASLLDSDLTEFLAGKANVVVPVVCGNYSSYSETYQTISILKRLGVVAIAPVLNWRQPCSRRVRRERVRWLPSWIRNRVLRRFSKKEYGRAEPEEVSSSDEQESPSQSDREEN